MPLNQCRRQSSARGAPASRGVALIEVLVALLIFMIGILGVIGQQVALTRAQTSGKFRVDAALLAEEYVGRMWGDMGHAGAYAIDGSGACTTASNQACADWIAKLANRLPGGNATVEVQPTGDVTIEIRWTVPSDGEHKYQTSDAIRAPNA